MVKEAQTVKTYNLIEVREAEAEKIPYKDRFFDYVSCLSTFDATHQHKALSEMMRVLKIKGLILLTGKNANYYDDDVLAIDAEKGARHKGHPNYFTHVKKLKNLLYNKGHRIKLEYYFPRRGDFGKLNFYEKMPQKFYEYFFFFFKLSRKYKFEPFSSKFSNVRGARS